jgi:hypothetical protein
MIPRPFKSTKRVDLIENGKVTHYFKIVFLDGSSAVFDNNFNLVMKSKIVNNNNGGKNGLENKSSY